MKVPGSKMNTLKDVCYIPVFNHGLDGPKDGQTIIMGNIMLQKYYMVYDMSPLEKVEGKSKDYI